MNQEQRSAIKKWWDNLNPNPDAGRRPSGNNAAKRALMRRCKTLEDILLTEGFRDLWYAVDARRNEQELLTWAAIASVLSEVKSHESNRRLGTAAGALNAQGRACVSEKRFARLQSARSIDELVLRLKRLLPLIQHQLDVVSIAQDIQSWMFEKKSARRLVVAERVALKWAMDYYDASAKQTIKQ